MNWRSRTTWRRARCPRRYCDRPNRRRYSRNRLIMWVDYGIWRSSGVLIVGIFEISERVKGDFGRPIMWVDYGSYPLYWVTVLDCDSILLIMWVGPEVGKGIVEPDLCLTCYWDWPSRRRYSRSRLIMWVTVLGLRQLLGVLISDIDHICWVEGKIIDEFCAIRPSLFGTSPFVCRASLGR